VDDELGKLRRTAVRITSVPHEEFGEVTELGDREVGSERCLLPFFSNDPDTYKNEALQQDHLDSC